MWRGAIDSLLNTNHQVAVSSETRDAYVEIQNLRVDAMAAMARLMLMQQAVLELANCLPVHFRDPMIRGIEDFKSVEPSEGTVRRIITFKDDVANRFPRLGWPTNG